jgi:hypothetical protein
LGALTYRADEQQQGIRHNLRHRFGHPALAQKAFRPKLQRAKGTQIKKRLKQTHIADALTIKPSCRKRRRQQRLT